VVSRIRPVNPKRKAKLQEAQFGEQAELCRKSPCAVPSCEFVPGRCEPHHMPSRGAGGLDADTIPLCAVHHTAIHSLGRKTFEARYGVDLFEVRDRMRATVKAVMGG